jgi:hypothetical protein
MGKTVRKIIITIVYFGILIGLIVYHDPINKYIVENYIFSKDVSEYTTNKYAKRTNYNYVSITDDFATTSKKDLLNDIYTIVDSGLDEFTFYCDDEYTDCISDVEELSSNTTALTIINNFVNPFNSFNKLYISTNSMGKINIMVDKLYSSEEITYTEDKISNIMSQVITNDMTINEKIKAFHDYIINTTIYDEDRSNEIKNKIYNANIFNSHKASGVLENHIALCSGYTDVMAVFLNTIGVPNFKVSNNDHIWNAVYIDNAWYHLDLTWDDPVTDTGANVLIYDFFLIDDATLFQKETVQHAYDASVYSEIATR